MKWFLSVYVAGCLGLGEGSEIRRIGLDGTPREAGPAEETGKDGFSRIRQLSEPLLEVYSAAHQPSCGTVIVSPGGGYAGLAVGHEGREVAQWLNEAGWDAAVLLYRVSAGEQTRELALADAQAALDLVKARGGELGLRTTKIGAIGFSAGGHLSARLARQKKLDFVALIYPAYLDENGKCRDEVSPVRGPVFLYVAEDDPHAPASFAYERACRANGIRCDFHHPALGGHGFGLKPDRKESVRDWPEKLRMFLAEGR
jgi:acetyl esterase/lipase